MLIKLLLRLITRDVPSIISFFHKLEAEFTSFLERHSVELDGLYADITAIEAQAKAKVIQIEETIAVKLSDAEVVLGLKNALPTTKS